MAPQRQQPRAHHISDAQLQQQQSGGAGGGVGGDDIVLDKVPFNPDEDEWDGVSDEDDPHHPPDYCVDCENDQDEEEREANPSVQEYRSHYIDNVLKVSRKRLAAQTQTIYNLRTRNHTEGRPVYRKRMIAEHNEVHAPEPKVLRSQDFRIMNLSLKVIRENMIFFKDAKGRLSLDPGHLRLYMQVMKERDTRMAMLFPGKA